MSQSSRSASKFFVPAIYFVLMASCLTPIDFDTDSKGGIVVISGQVSTLTERNVVQIGITSPDERLPFPESNAKVVLKDENGWVADFLEDEFSPGSYISPGFTGIPGKTYSIEVTLADKRVYTSVPEKMPLHAGQINSTYEFKDVEYIDGEGTVSNQTLIHVYANANVPASNSPAFLKWNVEEVYLLSPTDFPDPFGTIPPPCFVQQNADPQRISLFDGSVTGAKELKRQLVATRIVDFSFLERHYFTTYQSSITPEAYEYWRKVNILANQVGSIFDSPPAEINGNIISQGNTNEKTLGYFQAMNETLDRFFVLPENIPGGSVFKSCVFTGSFNPNDYPTRCLNCLTVRNSSYRRPDWF